MTDDSHTADLRTPTPTKHGRAGRNLPAAIAVGVVLIGTAVLTLLFWHPGFALFITALLVLAALEISAALRRIDLHVAVPPVVAGSVVITFGSYLASAGAFGTVPAGTFLLIAVALTTVAALVWRMFRGADGFVKDAAASLFVIGYLPLLGSFVPLMLTDDIGVMRIVTFVAVVVAGDTGGYVVGVLFGKHPMAPKISPKKSWEGLFGSYLFGCAVGLACAVWLLDTAWWAGIVLGVALVSVGVCGDLVESLIKRDVGIKDMSSILPGHGGVMDRLDSLLLSAPAAWLLMYILLSGVSS